MTDLCFECEGRGDYTAVDVNNQATITTCELCHGTGRREIQ